jgi:hypothetical protein
MPSFSLQERKGRAMHKLHLNILRLVCVLALAAPNLARADACGDEITRQEARLNSARASGGGESDMRESNFATMHRQPTPSTVARAKGESDSKAASALERARKLHEDGREQECLRVLKEIDAE